MAEMVIGEKITLEEMGGAKMHCEVSGCGDFLAKDERDAIAIAQRYFAYMPENVNHTPPKTDAKKPKADAKPFDDVLPKNQNSPFSIHEFIDALIDDGSFVEVKKRFAQEIVCGFARLGGQAVGIVASQPKYKGGVLFVDSADKAARFIWLCDA